MDYSQLSDFEINRMVGDIIFKGLWASKPETSGNNTNKWYYGNADTTFEPLNHLPDYCNDPSASWPIIEKYRISILDQLTEWCVDAKGVSPSRCCICKRMRAGRYGENTGYVAERGGY